MTTQLTEAGQKLADALVKAGAMMPEDLTYPEQLAPLNTAAQILLTPEGGGGRQTADVGVFGPIDGMGNLDRSGSYIGLSIDSKSSAYGFRISMGAAEVLLAELAGLLGDFSAALAPKTSVPGNAAGMREGVTEFDVLCAGLIGRFASGADFSEATTALAQFALDNRSRIHAALSPPTGSAGDDETGVREDEDVKALARAIAAGKCGTADPTGANLPDDIWRQALPEAERRIADALASQPPKAETPAGVGEDEAFRAWFERTSLGQGDRGFAASCFHAGYRAILSLAPAAQAGDGVEREITTLLAEKKPSIESSGDFVGVTFDLSGEARQFAQLLAKAALTAAPAANGEGA